ncbi:unnamed protein product [Paramecium sonneborni]|uniref:Uncharacterized protein n=1 Tax=Paramecium sonneborni TaxID=65129 RepID=A0A8S1NUQ5_9CILI|nr:unnamed protein product [Paramecium sonneborni]
MNSTKSEILFAGFNQDSSMFCVGTDTGFRVCNAMNSTEKFQRDLKGGIGHVEMLYRSNILALVGGGLQPKYPDNKVIIWDDHLVKCIGEMSFRTKIKNVKLKNDRVVVVLEKKIFVYNFTDLKLLDQIETCPNPRGICTINTDGDHTILATLEKSVGKVFVNNYDSNKAYCIEAHVSPISYLQLNSNGTKLATSSEKGTVIRIYDTNTGQISQELRRGNDYATITSLAFDFRSQWLGCASDQGTIHIFAVNQEGLQQEQLNQNQVSHNPKSKFEFLKGIIPILGSEWSFAQFRVLDTKCKVSFVPDEHQLIVISYEGKYYKAQFDPQKGGECIKVEEKYLISDKI